MTAPMKVLDKEREEHVLIHNPFRACCPVLCKDTRTQHESSQGPGINKDTSNEVPRISVDYFFCQPGE